MSLDDLLIHCAVLAEPLKEAKELLEYLVETCPIALEKRDSDGNTPLMTACILGRLEAIKTLIAANADQAAKNHKGENVVHLILRNKTTPHRMEPVFALFDQDLLKNHLFQQRKNLQENGNAPIHSWVSRAVGVEESAFTAPRSRYNHYRYNRDNHNSGPPAEVVATLAMLLKYTSGNELELLNGAGDTPLHTAIMKDNLAIVNVLIRHKPELLFRENAVGRTPFEIAQARVTEKQFERPSNLSRRDQDKSAENLLEAMKVERSKASDSSQTFDAERTAELLQKFGLSRKYDSDDLRAIGGSLGINIGEDDNQRRLADEKIPRVMLDLCSTAQKDNSANRRLVSLNEANDVAKRLGEQFVGSRYFTVQSRGEDEEGDEDAEEEEKKEKKSDFVVGQRESYTSWKTWGSFENPSDDVKEHAHKCKECEHWHE